MNAAREWTWLQHVISGTVTANGRIAIPNTTAAGRLKKVYALRVGDKTLQYVNQRDWLREVDITQNIGATAFYTVYDIADTATIEVLDHPAVDTAYTLYYLSLITTQITAEVIDVPESVMGYILSKAKADYIAATDGSSSKLSFYVAQAEQRWRRIVRDDEASQPDQELVLKPGYLYPSGFFTNLAPYGYE
jgi:hypothetical protein